MAQRVQMPQLGATMAEGRLVKWLVAEGQPVRKGQSIAEIETDKIVADVEAPADGVLARIVAQPDEVVEVTGLLGWIAVQGEDISPAEEGEQQSRAAVPGEAAVEAPATHTKPPATGERVLASPRARQLARELRLELSRVTGSGPGGRITGQDIEAYAATERQRTPPSVPEVPVREVVPPGGVRSLMARRIAESAHATAAATLFAQADASVLVRLEAELKGAAQSPLVRDAFLIKIAARALRECAYMNVLLTERGIERLEEINVGFVLATEDGLLVPVIRDADHKSLRLIGQEVQELMVRARTGGLSPDHLGGGTFAISNLGMVGVECFTPPINLPQCAVLGIGQIAPRPTVLDGKLAVREMVWLGLTFDHRVVDGAPAAQFLRRVVELVEEPRLLLV